MDKETKRTGNVYHYERTKNARYTWVQEMMRMGPEQFDQILQAIEPCTYLQKVQKDGWGWFNIGCLIGFSTTSSSSAILSTNIKSREYS